MSIQKLQVNLHVQNHPDLPRLNWQSCGFLPFPYSQQGYVNFNSWWAAYNSSSLGANVTGGPGFPYEKQTGHLQKVSQWTSLFFPSSNSVQCLISRLLSSSDLLLHKPKPWGDMKKTNIKKRNSIQKWRTGGIQYTPEHLAIHPYDSTAQCTASVCRSILAAWAPRPTPLVKAHQINIRQEEFPGRVRN